MFEVLQAMIGSGAPKNEIAAEFDRVRAEVLGPSTASATVSIISDDVAAASEAIKAVEAQVEAVVAKAQAAIK